MKYKNIILNYLDKCNFFSFLNVNKKLTFEKL